MGLTDRSVTSAADRDAVLGRPFDDGDELHELAAAVVAQEPVDLYRPVFVGGVDGGEGVPFDLVLAQCREPAHHLVERGLAGLVAAIRVVDVARPVDTEADEEAVLLEEPRPVAVDLGAVGLDRVDDCRARAGVLLAQLDGPAEELEPHEHRLAALPGDLDLRRAVRLHELPDVALEKLIAHVRPRAGIQLLLLEEEAVGAVEVAHGAGGLGQQVEGPRRGVRDEERRGVLAGLQIIVQCDSSSVDRRAPAPVKCSGDADGAA